MKNASPAFAGEAFSVVRGDTVSGGNNLWGWRNSNEGTAGVQLIFGFFRSSQNTPSFSVRPCFRS